MKYSRLWSVLAITAIMLTILVPIINHFNNVQNVQAASTWNKYAGNPVISSGTGTFNGFPAVILDGSTYKMWYVETTVSTGINDYIDGIDGLDLGNLITDLEAGNFASIAASDSQNIKYIISYLAGLSTIDLGIITGSIQTTVKYATSTDRTTWTDQGMVTFPAGTWDPLVSSLNVIKDTTTNDYNMWYSGYKIDPDTLAALLDALDVLTADDIQNIFGDLVDRDIAGLKSYINESGNPDVYDAVIEIMADLLYFADASKPAIGYATSTDGLDWSKDPDPVLESLNSDWDSQGVMTPSVIKNSDTSYDMWYTGLNITINLSSLFAANNLDELETEFLNSINYSICHAISTDGENWDTATRVITKGDSSAWDSGGVFAPSVVKTGTSSWEMWYTGIKFTPGLFFDYLQEILTMDNLLANGTNMAIGHATSSNGITWSEDSSPVLTKTSGTWDKHGVGYPSVVQNSSVLYMWYTGMSISPIDSLVSLLDDSDGNSIDGVLSGNQTAIGLASLSTSSGGGGGGGGGSAGITIPVILTGLTPADDLKIDKQGKIGELTKLSTADGKCSLTIPAGTYLMDKFSDPLTALSVVPMSVLPAAPDGKTVLLSYEFTPSGAKFSPAITITIKYDPAVLPAGTDPSKLEIGYWNGTTWNVAQAVVDTATDTITFTTNHFSVFAVIYPAVINLVTTTTTTATTPVPVVTTTSTTTTKPIPVTKTITQPSTTTTPVLTSTTMADIFTLNRLAVSPREIHIGGYVTITVWVNNVGVVPGSYRLDLKIDDKFIESRVIWVEAGTSTEVNFDIEQDTAGTHTININGQTTTFITLENAAQATKNNFVLIIVIGSAIFIITLIITAYLSWRRTKRYGLYRK